MNLLSFRTALRARVGNPTVAETPNSELDERINESVKDITEKYGFHKGRKVVTFPTVIGQSRYTMPDDCVVVMKLRIPAENVALRKRDETWASDNETLENGMPLNYLRERDWVQLFPPPDDIYTLELKYKASAAAMTLDADEPVFPSTWDQGVLYLARWKYWDVRGDLEKASFAYNAWKLWVKDKPSEIAEELFADDTEGVRVVGLRRSRYTTFNRDIDE